VEKLRNYSFEVPTSARHNGQRPDGLSGLKIEKPAPFLKEHSPFNIQALIRGLWNLGNEGTNATIELLELLNNPIWRGEGMPRGRGETTILIPGLLAGAYPAFIPMEYWLKRIGYRPKALPATFLMNYGSIKILARDLVVTCQKELERSGQKTNVIGHSKGGYIALAALKFYPKECNDSIKHIVAMGVPINPPIELNYFVERLYRLNVGLERFIHYGQDDFGLMKELGSDFTIEIPKDLSLTLIESCQDGIIEGRGNNYFTNNRYIISGSHVGMVFNSEVYRIIGHSLAFEKQRRLSIF